MLTWMFYVVVITLLLSGAALAGEHAARVRRRPSRWIWAATIVASLVIPTLIASVSIQVPNLVAPTVSRKAVPLRNLTSIQVVPLTWVQEHTGKVAAVHSENRVLQRTWIAVSVALLVGLVLNGVQLIWHKRRWRVDTVAGVSVYIGREVGPAVVGLLRPRIVVPDWLLEASPSCQAMVLTHEQSHLEAHDPQLLTVALFLLVLMPWNVPLWWQLHRLRYAIEVDCDARVLKAGVDTGQYGETLIDVSQRPSGYIGSVAAMSESRSFLEERITIMVRDPAKWGSLIAVMFGGLSLALMAVAAQVTPPNVGSSDTERQTADLAPEILDKYVGFYLRGANLVFAVTREGDHLQLRPPWLPEAPPVELAAKDEKDFVDKEGNFVPLSFLQDASGRVTGLVMHYGPFFGISFSVAIPRIDASTAGAINENNDLRFRSQTPMPGSEEALRRLIDGMLAGNLPYDELTPWYAELARTGGRITRVLYAKRGAVRSIEFSHVSDHGADVYRVRQDGGFSTWFIYLNANGLVEDADDIAVD
ncbi:MAG TPA: M56 family metallopeptidase [Steroidobacteraceae bacterium]